MFGGGLILRHVIKQTNKICLEAVKQDINSLIHIDIKYVKFIYKYLKNINFKNLKYNYEFIINKDSNSFKKYYIHSEHINGWVLKYVKQSLNLCKFVIDNINCYYIGFENNYFGFINYKKVKLYLQIIKTYGKRFKYINKQYIEVLL